MGETEIELEGMGALLAKLEDMSTKVAKDITKNALTKAGEYLEEEIKKEAPNLTGNLIKSIKVSPIKTRTKGGIKFVWVGDVDRKAEYSWCVEYGTSKTPADPFMARAFNKNKSKVKEIIAEELKRGLGI
jgi:HK97 gp10 family phage protein